MSFANILTIQGKVGAVDINGSISRPTNIVVGCSQSFAAAKSGVLHVRGSDTAGTLTLEADHGIGTGDIIDIYWDGGSRQGVTVGTVSVLEVPFSLGAGDVLPVITTPMTASKRTEVNIPDFTGNDVVLGVAQCEVAATVTFVETEDAECDPIPLDANEPWVITDLATDGVLTGKTPVKMLVSQSAAVAKDVVVAIAI